MLSPQSLDESVAILLDAIDAGDPERAHGEADALILQASSLEIQAAYARLVDRCKWWAYA